VEAHHREWLNLIEIEGPFLSIPVLKKAFPNGLDDPADTQDKAAAIRAALEEWELGLETGERATIHQDWARFVLRYVLELDDEVLRESPDVPSEAVIAIPEHGETLAPDYVVVQPKGEKDEGAPRLLVQVVPPEQHLDAPMLGKRWKASPADRMAELLRGAGKTGVPLGLLTNGSRWMLVHAPRGETVGRATWDAVLWVEERITLRAFRSLLGLSRFFNVGPDDTLVALLTRSAEDQQDLTNQLGYQVRRAVEVIVQGFDRLDRDSGRKLLGSADPRVLYEASVTLMMRMVFLLYAEEQGLLPLEDPFYSANYSASKLLDQLQEEADHQGPGVLERRHSAWSRLLATFRAVHGGVEHEAMRLPAYGGSLFDPDRYPFLEGRAEGTSWRNTPAQPLAIDDHTVLQILGLLQYLGSKSFDGRGTQAMRLSFKGLGVEQIGHVYEGLLDHTAVRATQPVLGLLGKAGQEPEIPIPDLDQERGRGEEHFLGYLKDTTQKTEKSLEKALAYEISSDDPRWLVACDNDSDLLAQVEPYTGVVRDDPSGHPVVIPEGSIYVTQGSDRRSTGAHYTPPSLTEPIAKHTLEPLVYEGPAEGKPEEEWKLRSPREILALRLCDLAMGSGAFLVAACRYLAERLVEAWEECEKARPGQILVTPEGDLSEGEPREALVPADATERLAAARRFVADRCLYGVDKDPMAVEMGKLSLWLVTLQKGKPFSFLDHALKCGDSLLGVSRREQLEAFDLLTDGKGQLDLFGKLVGEAMATAREKRERLERMAVNDVRDAEEKGRLLAEADAAVVLVCQAGDLLTAVGLSTAKEIESAYESRRGALAEAFSQAIAEGLDEATRQDRLTALESRARKLLDQGKPATERARKPFHWPIEFPEVFANGAFDAFVGNPLFLGGRKLRRSLGDVYTESLPFFYPGFSGNANLGALFFVRALTLVLAGGVTGMLCTNAIAQGDTRTSIFEPLLDQGNVVFRANTDLKWPGAAAVTISMIFLSRGSWSGKVSLNDEVVASIGPALSDDGGSASAVECLAARSGQIFQGTVLAGDGFLLSKREADEIRDKHPEESDVVMPYLGGRDLGNSPTQKPSRWVVNFFDRPLTEAEKYPICLDLVRERVRPKRLGVRRKVHRERWWQFGDKRPELYGQLEGLTRALACPEVTIHLIFSWVPCNIVLSQQLRIVTADRAAWFSVLQSSIHAVWARREGVAKLGAGAVPRYVPSFSFESFALPQFDSNLDAIADAYWDSRSRIQLSRSEGLTKIYNLFHDPDQSSEDIAELRHLHRKMDEAVAAAYGWGKLDLGHEFRETGEGTRYTLSPPARREVLDRLLELNHQYYAEEVAQGLHAKKKPKALRKSKANAASTAQPGLFDTLTAAKPNTAGAPSSDTQAIASALGQADHPLSKSELLEATGISENQWNRAIKPALDSGAVTKTGERRGTRYSIPPE